MDEHGTIRVGDTRVTLEVVVGQIKQGQTPEQIVESYDALSLKDVFLVKMYYLQNREQVDEYVRQSDEEFERIRRETEAQDPDRAGLRERLLKRMEEKNMS